MTDGTEMETLSQATTRLSKAGYVENYTARDGHLACGKCGASYDPATVTIDEIVRFEGQSNPDDEAVAYAIDAGCGHRGLYVSAYGPDATADDIAVVAALPDARP
ncbi:hypothetical protein [Ilumatobacter coccineus]|jgi:hypothetical protein|nr:hypothetical protein [Ilumatobacter coccineus]